MIRYYLVIFLLMPLLAGCSIRTNQSEYDSFSDKGVECTLVIRQKVIPGFFVHSSPWYTWGRTIIFKRGESNYIKAIDGDFGGVIFLGGNTLVLFRSNHVAENKILEYEIGYIDITNELTHVSWIGVLPQVREPSDELSKVFGDRFTERYVFSSDGDKILFRKIDSTDCLYWLSSDQSTELVTWNIPNRLKGRTFLLEGFNPVGEPLLKEVNNTSYGGRRQTEN